MISDSSPKPVNCMIRNADHWSLSSFACRRWHCNRWLCLLSAAIVLLGCLALSSVIVRDTGHHVYGEDKLDVNGENIKTDHKLSWHRYGTSTLTEFLQDLKLVMTAKKEQPEIEFQKNKGISSNELHDTDVSEVQLFDLNSIAKDKQKLSLKKFFRGFRELDSKINKPTKKRIKRKFIFKNINESSVWDSSSMKTGQHSIDDARAQIPVKVKSVILNAKFKNQYYDENIPFKYKNDWVRNFVPLFKNLK